MTVLHEAMFANAVLQHRDGAADLVLRGDAVGPVTVRAVDRTGNAVTEWQHTEAENGAFQVTVPDIPVGDGYRIEYGAAPADAAVSEASFGVGMVVGAFGQSNISRWFGPRLNGEPSLLDPAAGARQWSEAKGWTAAEGEGAVHFTRTLHLQLDMPIALVQISKGGSVLLESYNRRGDSGRFWLDDPELDNGHDMLDRVADALASLPTSLGAVIWAHGESDASNPELAPETYIDGLTPLFTEIRSLTGNDALPVLMVGLSNRQDGRIEDWNAFRAAQSAYAGDTKGVYLAAATDDLPHQDGVHHSAAAYNEIAHRVAAKLLELSDAPPPDGANRIYGTDASDVILGSDSRDVLFGGTGDDSLTGKGSKDLIGGGFGDDLLRGGGGRDALFGEAGSDILIGGGNADRLDGGNGDDRLYGSDGGDVLIGNDGDDWLYGGRGADRYIYRVGDGNDVYDERDGDVVDSAGVGGDRVILDHLPDLSEAQFDRVAFNGNSWAGNLKISDPAGAEILLRNHFSTVHPERHFEEIERADGQRFALSAGTAGTDADDVIVGRDRKDRLEGGAGDDLLFGNGGDDVIRGGNGDDRYVYRQGDGHDRYYEGGTESGPADLDRVILGDIADWNRLDLERVALKAGGWQGSLRISIDDAPAIDLQHHFSTVDASRHFEQLRLADGSVYRLSADLKGSAEADILVGRDHADDLFGGRGDDILSGGGGPDRFILTPGDGHDRILDFSGEDRIDLKAFEWDAETVQKAAVDTEDGLLLHLTPEQDLLLQNQAASALDLDWFLL